MSKLRDEMSARTDAILAPSATGPSDPTGPSPRPGRSTAPGQLFAFTEQQKQMEREIADLRRQAGGPRLILRSKLRKSPYQTRTISEAAVKELADNLKENDLASALTVRQIEPDVYEIVAGHRRDAAFGLLGRAEIPCVVVEMTDDQAERAVFFDNFFPADLSDFEKYQGLKLIQRRHNHSHEELARKSGISRQLVSALMAFERLPEAALTVLAKNQRLLGANAAAKLAQLGEEHAERIAQGLQLIAEKKLTQSQLIDWIQQKTQESRSEPVLVKSKQKGVFARVTRRQDRITLDFSRMDDAAALEKKIAALIKDHFAASVQG